MSQAIRTVGVGLLGAGWLAMHFQAEFVSLVGDGNSPIIRNLAALQADSPLVAHITGAGLYLPAIFILGCLGVGLFAAGMVYPFLENAAMLPLEIIGRFISKSYALSTDISDHSDNRKTRFLENGTN